MLFTHSYPSNRSKESLPDSARFIFCFIFSPIPCCLFSFLVLNAQFLWYLRMSLRPFCKIDKFAPLIAQWSLPAFWEHRISFLEVFYKGVLINVALIKAVMKYLNFPSRDSKLESVSCHTYFSRNFTTSA